MPDFQLLMEDGKLSSKSLPIYIPSFCFIKTFLSYYKKKKCIFTTDRMQISKQIKEVGRAYNSSLQLYSLLGEFSPYLLIVDALGSPSFPSCEALSKLLNVPKLLFSHLQTNDGNSNMSQVVLRMHGKQPIA